MLLNHPRRPRPVSYIDNAHRIRNPVLQAIVTRRIAAFNQGRMASRIAAVGTLPVNPAEISESARRRRDGFYFRMEHNMGIRRYHVEFLQEIVSIAAQLVGALPTDMVQVCLEAGNGQGQWGSLPYHPVSWYDNIQNADSWWDMIDELDESEGHWTPIVIDENSFYHVIFQRRTLE